MASLFLVSAVISISGIVFLKDLARILGADETMTELVCDYLKYLLYFSPALILSYALATFLRNDNKPGLGMIAMIFGGLANGILDYVFIFVFNMGIEGAGLATGLGPVFSILIMMPHFFLKKGDLYFRLSAFSFRYCKKILTAGIPAFITEYSLGIVTYLHNFVIIRILGEQGVAAYGIIGYVALIVLTFYLGISQAVSLASSRCRAHRGRGGHPSPPDLQEERCRATKRRTSLLAATRVRPCGRRRSRCTPSSPGRA